MHGMSSWIGSTNNMLTILECREYLDVETSESLTDEEVEAVRNDLYRLAGLILDSKRRDGYENRKTLVT